MGQLTVAAPSGLGSAQDGSHDAELVQLWLSLKISPHTRRAYAAEAQRFLAFLGKPLAWATLSDLQAWAGPRAGKWTRLATQFQGTGRSSVNYVCRE